MSARDLQPSAKVRTLLSARSRAKTRVRGLREQIDAYFEKERAWLRGCGAAAGLALAPALAEDAWYAWSPKPDKLVPYGKNKPVTRLSAVLAKHKGQKRWSEQVILTPRYDTKWIQAAPGDKTPDQY